MVYQNLYLTPSLTSRRRAAPRLNRVTFGNGYSQKIPDGINANMETWDIVATLNSDLEKITLENFFIDNYATYFNWKSPESGATAKLYECASWEIEPLGNGNYSVTAVFMESPNGVCDYIDQGEALEMVDDLEMVDNLEML